MELRFLAKELLTGIGVGYGKGVEVLFGDARKLKGCLLYTSPSPRD